MKTVKKGFFVDVFFHDYSCYFSSYFGHFSKKIDQDWIGWTDRVKIWILALCLCCIYCVCSVVWRKVNFNCDLKFSGPRSRYLVVRNRINKAMETVFFTININWKDFFEESRNICQFISQQCNLWMQFKLQSI